MQSPADRDLADQHPVPIRKPPAISLVVATLGRSAELVRLFDTLARQTYTDFDVIVVDQNDDDRLVPITAQERWPFPVRHLRTPGARGASRARNTGWRASSAPLLHFPDDDSWFDPDFLAIAIELATRLTADADAVAGRLIDETGRNINSRFEETAQDINRGNVWTTAIEAMVIFRREMLEATDGFSEDVGVGAASPWQAAEIQDILLRGMALGFTARFDPRLAGYHQEIVIGHPDARILHKARGYGRGMGYVLRLHRYGWLTIGSWLFRPIGGVLVSLATGRLAMARYYRQIVVGRVEGAFGWTFGNGDLAYADWAK